MSTPRLLFLYPPFWHSAGRIRIRKARPLPTLPKATRRPKEQHRAFSNNGPRLQDYPQRYGTAHEPTTIELPPPEAEAVQEKTRSLAEGIEQEVRTANNQNATGAPQKSEKISEKGPIIGKDFQPFDPDKPPDPAPDTTPPSTSPQPSTSSSLSEILNPSPPPSELPDSSPDASDKPPHLSPRRYTHHFDTYTLVSRLTSPSLSSQSSNTPTTKPFTETQAITLMKAVRALLTHNLTIARAALHSKSTLEKQNYTFTAACSEMRTSIGALKRRTANQTNARLAHSRHEVEILSQRLQQDTLTLRDEMKGMLDDRRMASRMEDRERESWMQELNTMIAVKLVSGVKSEVESLRWFLTRSAALTLLGFVVTALMVLRIGSSRKGKEKLEREEKGKFASTVPSREMGTQTRDSSSSTGQDDGGTSTISQGTGSGEEALYKSVGQGGNNPGYVQLG